MNEDAPITDPTKPGQLTTEFWTNIFTQVVGAVMAIAALFGHHLDGSYLQPLIGMAALVAMGISAAYYSHSRATVKAAIATSIAAMPTPTLPTDPTASDVPADLGADPSSGSEDTLDDSEQQAAMESRGAN